jgi:hypothetical protein
MLATPVHITVTTILLNTNSIKYGIFYTYLGSPIAAATHIEYVHVYFSSIVMHALLTAGPGSPAGPGGPTVPFSP